MNPELFCQVENRRRVVRDKSWNGFDYLEVEEVAGQKPGEPCVVQLHIFLLGKNAAGAGDLDPCQFQISGGFRVPTVAIQAAKYVAGVDGADDTIVLTTVRPND